MLMFAMKFDGRKARKLRTQAGVTLGDAAGGIGITQDLLRRYENGTGGFTPGPEVVERMAQVYRCGVEEFYT